MIVYNNSLSADTESCTGSNTLLFGVIGGTLCVIIACQSLVIVILFLQQKKRYRLVLHFISHLFITNLHYYVGLVL